MKRYAARFSCCGFLLRGFLAAVRYVCLFGCLYLCACVFDFVYMYLCAYVFACVHVCLFVRLVVSLFAWLCYALSG